MNRKVNRDDAVREANRVMDVSIEQIVISKKHFLWKELDNCDKFYDIVSAAYYAIVLSNTEREVTSSLITLAKLAWIAGAVEAEG